ncbi:MAG: hypothetical protein V4627_14550 [Pseudomonadota bacterium]
MTERSNEVDWIQVSRVGYQLEQDRGPNAYLYAAELAVQAKQDNKTEDADFWQAVSASLAPRSSRTE